MAITRLYKCKDFSIRSYYYGSRLKDGPEYAYEVIYHGENGKGYHRIDGIFFTKTEARAHISRLVKKANAVLKKAHEQGRIHLNSLR